MHFPSAALIEEAARLHGRGALAEAASRYRQVLEGEPAHASALYHLAVIACQQGRFGEGIELARRSLASDPQQPRAHNMLGMALSRCGEHDAALASFERAVALAPELADAHGNRAGALMELGRVPEAVASYQSAVALRDDSIGDWLDLGTALHRLGRHEEAIASYDRALALQPEFPGALCNRGHVLAHVGRHEEALASYDRALAVNRRYPDALTGRAKVLLGLGRIEGALVNLEEVLAQAPDHPGVAGRLIHALIARGEIARALTAVMRVLAHKETQEAKALFVDCVRNRRLTSDPGGVRACLLRALTEPWDRPADLAGPAVSLVKLDPAIRACCTRAAAVWPKRLALEDLSGRLTAIADDQLLRGLLETVPVCDVELERCLTGMRAILLGTAADGPAEPAEDGLLRFFCALARQGFINEYVFDATAEELEQVRLMRERIARAVSSGGTVPVLWLIAVAAYLPLHSLPGVETLLDRVWSPAVAALLTQQVREPQHERRLRTSIPALTAIADEVSRKVADQYEDNPYPRWVKPAPKGAAKTIAQYFGSWLQPAGTDQRDAVDILVAGCGTGQNPPGCGWSGRRAPNGTSGRATARVVTCCGPISRTGRPRSCGEPTSNSRRPKRRFAFHKSELSIRPIWHQHSHRVLAHILVCFLAYVLWKTLEQWQSRAGLGNSPRTILEEFARIHSTDIVLPTASTPHRELRLRCVVRPDREQAALLDRLGLCLPERLKIPINTAIM